MFELCLFSCYLNHIKLKIKRFWFYHGFQNQVSWVIDELRYPQLYIVMVVTINQLAAIGTL